MTYLAELEGGPLHGQTWAVEYGYPVLRVPRRRGSLKNWFSAGETPTSKMIVLDYHLVDARLEAEPHGARCAPLEYVLRYRFGTVAQG